jgi:hypothetical protein
MIGSSSLTRCCRPRSRIRGGAHQAVSFARPRVARCAEATSGTSTSTSTTTTTSSSVISDSVSDFRAMPRRTALAAGAAAVAALAAPAGAARAVPFPSLFGGGGSGPASSSSSSSSSDTSNSSVVRALQQRQKRERMFGTADADPRPLLAARLAAARAEAARIPLLVRIDQPDSARMLLREKNLGNLRRDLAYLTGAYAMVVPEQDVREVVTAVERLDGALRRLRGRGGGGTGGGGGGGGEEAAIKGLVAELDARLERVAAAVTALEGEAR